MNGTDISGGQTDSRMASACPVVFKRIFFVISLPRGRILPVFPAEIVAGTVKMRYTDTYVKFQIKGQG